MNDTEVPTDYETNRRRAEARRRQQLLEGRADALLREAGRHPTEADLRAAAETAFPNRPEAERAAVVERALQRVTVQSTTSIPAPRQPELPVEASMPNPASRLPDYDSALHSKALSQLIRQALAADPEVTREEILRRIPTELGFSADGQGKRVSDRLSWERSKSRAAAEPELSAAETPVQVAEVDPAPSAEPPSAPTRPRRELYWDCTAGALDAREREDGSWALDVHLTVPAELAAALIELLSDRVFFAEGTHV